MADYYKEGFENIRPKYKKELQRMFGIIGIVGVLEILSELSEEQSDFFMKASESPAEVAFWNGAAAAKKQLSESLLRDAKQDDEL